MDPFTFDPRPAANEPFVPKGEPAGESKIVQALAYSADGGQLAVAGEDGTIAIWDAKAQREISELKGHADIVHALTWSIDGRKLVSASADRFAIIWDAVSHKPLHRLKHLGGVFAVAISSDGKTVATGGFDKSIRLWNADSGKPIRKLEGHTASIRNLAFSPNDEELASASSDFTVRLWSLKSEGVRELRGHSKVVRAVAYLRSRLVVSAGDDGFVRLWDPADGETKQSFGPFPDGVLSLAVSPGGTFVAAGAGNGKIYLLDTIDNQARGVLNASADGIAAVAMSPSGDAMASGGYDRTVRIWSPGAKPATPVVTFRHKSGVRAITVAPNGALVATGSDDGTIRLLDATTGEEKAQWKAHDGAVEDLSFSGDGVLLASGGSDRRAIVWRVANRQAKQTFADFPGPVFRVALSDNGNLLATASSDADIRIVDLKDGSAKKLNAESPLVSLQFLSDDTLLSAGGHRVYLWDVAGNRVLNTLDGGQFTRVSSAAASSDGKLIAIVGEPANGTQRAQDVGYCRVLAISRYNPTSTTQRMNDTGVGTRIAVSADARIIALVGGDGVLRAWDWPKLTPIRKFAAHNATIRSLAVSPRGDFIITASADRTARRWQASPGDPLIYAAKLNDESKQAWFARTTPDGKVLAVGGDDKVLRLRDAVPGGYRRLPGEYACTYSTTLSPDGKILATGHQDGVIRLWDFAAGKLLKEIKGHTHRVWSLAFAPDGSRLVSGGGDWHQNTPGELRIWNTSTWKATHELKAHQDLIFQVAVSPDNRVVASCSRDGTILTWEMATGKMIHKLHGHPDAVRCIAFTKDGKRLYSGGFDDQLHWWDVKSGRAIDSQAIGVVAIERMRLSPDGKTIALALKTGNNAGYPALWSIEKSQIVSRFEQDAGQVNDVAFTPDGKTLISVGGRYTAGPYYRAGPIGPWGFDETAAVTGKPPLTRFAPSSAIRLWDIASGRSIAELPGPKFWIETVVVTDDGSKLVAASGVENQPGDVRIYDLAGVRPKAILAGHTSGLTCACFSPDGLRLATGSIDTTVIVWDVAKSLSGDTSNKIVLKGHKKMIRSLAWSPDGSRLISSSEGGEVILWDPNRANALWTIAAHDRPVYGIAFSPGGKLIATAAGDWKNKKKGEVRVWDAAKGTEVFRLPDSVSPAWGVAFTTDEKLIATYSGEDAVRIFDLTTHKPVRTLTAPTAARGLTISPDGKYVGMTAQANGIIKIWEAKAWREAFELSAHPGKVVFTIDFAADHQTVVTAGGDGAVVIWKMPGGAYKLPEFVPPATPIPRKQPDDGIAIPAKLR